MSDTKILSPLEKFSDGMERIRESTIKFDSIPLVVHRRDNATVNQLLATPEEVENIRSLLYSDRPRLMEEFRQSIHKEIFDAKPEEEKQRIAEEIEKERLEKERIETELLFQSMSEDEEAGNIIPMKKKRGRKPKVKVAEAAWFDRQRNCDILSLSWISHFQNIVSGLRMDAFLCIGKERFSS